ncbi:MAG: putative serine protease HtrA [Anaerolineales bacterium]|nr:putative serine protease HtrA [Anaerolineales bacterium]
MALTQVIDRETWCECVELLESERQRRGPWQTLLLVVTLTIIITAGLVAGGFLIGFSANSISSPSSVLAAGVSPSQDQDLVGIYAELDRAVVKIKAAHGGQIDLERPAAQKGETGSGFIVTADGHIITNYHVVEDAEDIAVMLSTGDYLHADLVGADPATDMALLKIEPPAGELAVVRFGDSGRVKVGQPVLALGSPFGLERTLTVGHVSALERRIRSGDDYVTHIYGVIQTDAAINPGNSGGPLLDADGEVIGVNTAIFSTSRGSQGIGFAIPSNTVRQVLDSLLRTGYVSRPYLGIMGVALDDQLASQLDVSVSRGVLIEEVHPESGADLAGLQAGDETVFFRGKFVEAGGDVLLAIDDEEVDKMSDVSRIVSERQIGAIVKVTIVRDGETLSLAVPLRAAPIPEVLAD